MMLILLVSHQIIQLTFKLMKYFIILTLFLYSSHSWSASNYYDNALENFNETKYETAIKYLEKEIVFNPKSSESFVLLGKSYEKIDDLSTANKYYNIAFTLVPHNLELNFLLGAEKVLEKNKPNIFVEIIDMHCNRFGHKPLDVLNYLIKKKLSGFLYWKRILR